MRMVVVGAYIWERTGFLALKDSSLVLCGQIVALNAAAKVGFFLGAS